MGKQEQTIRGKLEKLHVRFEALLNKACTKSVEVQLTKVSDKIFRLNYELDCLLKRDF